MKKIKTKSLFGYETKAYPEAHKLSVALCMTGVTNNIMACESILRTQKAVKKLGGKFSISDAIEIKNQIDEEFSKLHEDYNNQI
jgi:hypothetical protein